MLCYVIHTTVVCSALLYNAVLCYGSADSWRPLEQTSLLEHLVHLLRQTRWCVGVRVCICACRVRACVCALVCLCVCVCNGARDSSRNGGGRGSGETFVRRTALSISARSVSQMRLKPITERLVLTSCEHGEPNNARRNTRRSARE
jgi:hypothetical protein